MRFDDFNKLFASLKPSGGGNVAQRAAQAQQPIQSNPFMGAVTNIADVSPFQIATMGQGKRALLLNAAQSAGVPLTNAQAAMFPMSERREHQEAYKNILPSLPSFSLFGRKPGGGL